MSVQHEIDDLDVEDLVYYASALYDGNAKDAEDLLRVAAALAGDDPTRLTRAAGQMLAIGDRRGSAGLWAQAGRRAPDDFELGPTLAHIGGRLAAAGGDETNAEQLLEAAFEAEPENPDHAVSLAAFHARRDRRRRALEVVEEGLVHSAGDAYLLDLRAKLESDP
jgi:uncharacterized protein HemY